MQSDTAARDSYYVALRRLSEIQTAGARGALVADDGFFEYQRNMPEYSRELEVVRARDGEVICMVPRCGDVLVALSLEGTYESARFFQYDELGTVQILYWQGDGGGERVARPFPDGIPLLLVGKALYLEAKGAAPDFKASCVFALLDDASRQSIMDRAKDIRLRHADGTAYRVYNLSDWGYSPNVLAPAQGRADPKK